LTIHAEAGKSAAGTMDTLFATETMADLSARQGRVADAITIYRHLVAAAEAASASAPDEAARVARWKARIAQLEVGGAAAVAPAPPQRPRARVQERASTEVSPTISRPSALVVQQPVRSGQVIYAEGSDLIVVASVHPGAQLLADGNIHVYGRLKGRAVAGARGARGAQIFCLALEAELVGVDTGYLTSDDIPPERKGGAARVFLTPDGRCAVVELSPGQPAAPAVATPARRLF
jgi:septum site-determining protein MinC